MPISFGRKNRVSPGRASDLLAAHAGQCAKSSVLSNSKAPARLADLRCPEAFRAGFIPGSYSLPDRSCWLAAQRNGLFDGREIYLLADDPAQLQMCEEFGGLSDGLDLGGWFGPDALLEWRRADINLAEIEAISHEALNIRLILGYTLALAITTDSEEAGTDSSYHPAALRFGLSELPLSLDGLPVETSICLSTGSEGVASFAASLLWNFGFHQVSYATRGSAETKAGMRHTRKGS